MGPLHASCAQFCVLLGLKYTACCLQLPASGVPALQRAAQDRTDGHVINANAKHRRWMLPLMQCMLYTVYCKLLVLLWRQPLVCNSILHYAIQYPLRNCSPPPPSAPSRVKQSYQQPGHYLFFGSQQLGGHSPGLVLANQLSIVPLWH